MLPLLLGATIAGTFANAATPAASSLTVFDDAFGAGFSLNLYNGINDPASTASVKVGTAAIASKPDSSGNNMLVNIDDAVALSGYGTLRFWINGGTAGVSGLNVQATNFTQAVPVYSVPAVAAATWVQVSIPLASLIPDAAAFDAAKTRYLVFSSPSAIVLDQIEFLPIDPTATTTTLATTTTAGPTSTAAVTTTTINPTCAAKTGPIQVMPLGDSLTEGGYGTGAANGSTPFQDSYRYELYRLLNANSAPAFAYAGHMGQNNTGTSYTGNTYGGIPPVGSGLTEFPHSGTGGITIESTTAEFDSYLAGKGGSRPINPDVVIVNLGTNGAAPSGFAPLVEKIKSALPNSVILLGTLPVERDELTLPVVDSRAAMRAEVLRIADASTTDRVFGVDVYSRMKAGNELAPALTAADFADGTHFNVTGGTKFAAALQPAVLAAIQQSAANRCGVHTVGTPTGGNGGGTTPSGGGVIFDDAFGTGFSLNIYNGVNDPANTSVVKVGSKAIATTPNAYSGIYVNIDDSTKLAPYGWLRFWINGGAGGSSGLRVHFVDSTISDAGGSFTIPDVAANTWAQFAVPLNSLVTNRTGFDAMTGRFLAITGDGTNRPVVYLDQLELLAPDAITTTTTTALPTTVAPTIVTTTAPTVPPTTAAPTTIVTTTKAPIVTTVAPPTTKAPVITTTKAPVITTTTKAPVVTTTKAPVITTTTKAPVVTTTKAPFRLRICILWWCF